MKSESKRLISPESVIGKNISTILSPLESQNNIQIERCGNGSVETFLPRYDLLLHINKAGLLESRRLNVEVDENQHIGTWIGLRNKLVVRDPRFRDYGIARSVLVPFGDVRVSKTKLHVQVEINPPSGDRLRYVLYRVNSHLKRLDGPDVLSTYFQAYLHAVTTFTEPDPFTGYTGTEMALKTLRKKYLFDTQPLDPEIQRMKAMISHLTPTRENSYHGVEHVVWDENLSSYAQHEEYLAITSAVDNHSRKHSFLYTSENDKGPDFIPEPHLIHQRAAVQDAAFRSFEFGGANRQVEDDQTYIARDTQAAIKINRAHCVYETVKYLKDRPSRINVVSDLPNLVQEWPNVSQFHSSYCQYRISDIMAFQWGDVWGAIYDLCRKKEKSSYHLRFLFGAIAMGKYPTWNADGVILRTCLAMAISNSFQRLNPPPGIRSYHSGVGFESDPDKLKEVLSGALDKQRFPERPDNIKGGNIKLWEKKQEAKREKQIEELAAAFHKQWPAQYLVEPPSEAWGFLDREKAVRKCQELWGDWIKNSLLLPHLKNIGSELAQMRADGYDPPFQPDLEDEAEADDDVDDQHPVVLPSFHELFSLKSPASIHYNLSDPTVIFRPSRKDQSRMKYPDVERVISHVHSRTDGLSKRYAENMSFSLKTYETRPRYIRRKTSQFSPENLNEDIEDWRDNYEMWFSTIKDHLAFDVPHMRVLELAGLLPRRTFFAFMQLLDNDNNSTQKSTVQGWENHVVDLLKSLKLLQRAERLLSLLITGDNQKLHEEAENKGLDDCLYERYPQWMLLEIENCFAIRKEQAEVALAMIERSTSVSGPNTVLQFQMGQGKSSVIIPMLIAALANGKRLVRVIVLRSLFRQSLEQLRRSFGGVLDRKLYHIPFSRRCRLDRDTIEGLKTVYQECKDDRGVVIALGEEILSLKLLTQDCQSKPRTNPEAATGLVRLVHWLEKNCCDILDESDEILSPRFQLIYPVGETQLLDDSSERWLLAQKILFRVDVHVNELKDKYPTTVEVIRKEKTFPFVHIFGDEASSQLLSWIVEDILDNRVEDLRLTDTQKAGVASYIQQVVQDPGPEITETIASLSNLQFKAILFFRGLIGHGLLLHSLQQKRWAVNYGSDRTRCKLAVPYQARNWPSENSEHAHLDFRILLTLLTYYYGGAEFDEICQCIRHPEAADNLHDWLRDSEELSQQFPSIESINLDDNKCRQSLIKGLSYNRALINFYLRNIVSPDEAKYSPKRLSASSWDIPALPGSHPTIGFSGTNEDQYILPMTIEQRDLPSTAYTNAHNLSKVLQVQNRSYSVTRGTNGYKLSSEELLKMISGQGTHNASGDRSPIRVLIDVGAQILDLRNGEVAQAWLNLIPDAEGAVFFGDNHEAKILDQQGRILSLQSSPFRDRLSRCLVYIDEAHTRGIDLPIPVGTAAAVTLGPNLLQDRLLQGMHIFFGRT